MFSTVSGVSEEHEWAALLLESVWRSFALKLFYKWVSVNTVSPLQGRGVCQSHALFDSRWKITRYRYGGTEKSYEIKARDTFCATFRRMTDTTPLVKDQSLNISSHTSKPQKTECHWNDLLHYCTPLLLKTLAKQSLCERSHLVTLEKGCVKWIHRRLNNKPVYNKHVLYTYTPFYATFKHRGFIAKGRQVSVLLCHSGHPYCWVDCYC